MYKLKEVKNLLVHLVISYDNLDNHGFGSICELFPKRLARIIFRKPEEALAVMINALEEKWPRRSKKVCQTEEVDFNERYPQWAENIKNGDFKVRVEKGKKIVEWPNTCIFGPTVADLNLVLNKEFSGKDISRIKLSCGFMSLCMTEL